MFWPLLFLAISAAATTDLTPQESTILSSFSPTLLESWSRYYTSGAHLAGKNLSQAEWTRDAWTSRGVASSIVPYEVFLTYPLHASVSLQSTNGSTYNPTLKENVLPSDPTTGSPDSIPAFHGYSATGNATGEYIYVGRARESDFARLTTLGVSLKGKIALAKYGGPQRGLKVRNAEAAGMAGIVLFTDPGDDATPGLPYPDGPGRNPSSVQRGSVLYFSQIAGDPTTVGYASKPGVERQDPRGKTIPNIPSVPMSYRDVAPILKEMNGAGKSSAEVGVSGWAGGLEGVDYSTGPAKGVKITVQNEVEEKITPLWDVVGVINGTLSDEVVVIGNHRDAWIVGGAADPNGGSAIMVQLAEAFGQLVKDGWKPRRTIVMASWDGEEYGMLGSTEWVEDHLPWLNATLVSYLNIDLAVSGPRLSPTATPDTFSAISRALSKVPSPLGGTLLDHWTTPPLLMGNAQSDHAAFVQAGAAAVDINFTNGPGDPVYHYHSNYDSLHWIQTYGDPGFAYQQAAGRFLGVLALDFIDSPILPLNVTGFAASLEGFYTALNKTGIDTSPLQGSIAEFKTAAAALVVKAAVAKTESEYKAVNDRLKLYSRRFVAQGGLPGRPFYKNVVYSPGWDTGYEATTFPGVAEAVSGEDTELAEEWVVKTSKGVKEAAEVLKF